MSNVKISSNLFLEVAELNRLKQTLGDWGYKRQRLANTREFGIVKDCVFPDLGVVNKEDSFYVEKAGTPTDEVRVYPGLAIDLNANFIVNKDFQNIQIPNDGIWYWVKIKHAFSNEEVGTVSIDTFGNLNGVGTEFENIFRGQPNFPTKIRFLNSTAGNGNDYEVVRVLGQTQAILQGDFITESNLKFAIVGTFTPGYVIPTADQKIFEYDSVEIDLVQETSLNTRPSAISDEEFYIARVRNTGLTLQLEDKREDWWRSQSENLVTYLNRSTHFNPLIGVESVKYTHPNSTRESNEVNIAWGFRFSSYTIDTSSKKISILIGQGGVFKDTSFFSSGDFTGWRLYSKNGNYQNIIDSQQSGTQIVVTLDVLNPDEYGNSDDLFIAPPFEGIELRFRRDGANIDITDVDGDGNISEIFPYPILEKKFEFSVNTPVAKCLIQTLDGCYKYNVTFRYKTLFGYTDWLVFPNDSVGYFDETSFDDYGNINPNPIDRVQVPYNGHAEFGFIKICEAPDSFQNFQEQVQTGDLIGVNTTALDNSIPVVELEVGVDKQYQHYKGSLVLSADMFIHLKRTKPNGDYFREGNYFLLHLEQWISLDNFRLRIVEDYVNPTSFTLLSEITTNETHYIRNQTIDNTTQSERRGLMIRCTFNELNHWIVQFESDVTPKGTIRMIHGMPNSYFDGLGAGIKKGVWGWQICNGQNGSINMINSFPMGVSSPSSSGSSGGQNSYILDQNQIPEHNHTFSGTTSTGGAHTHSLQLNVRDDGTSGIAGMVGRNSNAGSVTYPNGEASGVLSAGSHNHTFSGTTSNAGGVTTPTPIDNRPSYKGLLYIQKMV